MPCGSNYYAAATSQVAIQVSSPLKPGLEFMNKLCLLRHPYHLGALDCRAIPNLIHCLLTKAGRRFRLLNHLLRKLVPCTHEPCQRLIPLSLLVIDYEHSQIIPVPGHGFFVLHSVKARIVEAVFIQRVYHAALPARKLSASWPRMETLCFLCSARYGSLITSSELSVQSLHGFSMYSRGNRLDAPVNTVDFVPLEITVWFYVDVRRFFPTGN